MKIMIVEDDDSIRELLQEFLEHENHVVEAFRNGAEALTRLKHKCDFELIFFDLQMPVMNGREFMEEFKKLDMENPAATCLFTAENRHDLGEELGCTAQFRKPIDLMDIRKFIAGL